MTPTEASGAVVHVKICGVTSIAQAEAIADAGASAVGVNLIASSARRVDEATAAAIARAVGGRTLVVAVVADGTAAELAALRSRTAVGCLQLHGDEPDAIVGALLPHAYKAVRVATAEDLARAERAPGEHVLVDAKVEGALGGTGHMVDWALVAPLARRRKLTLAGGLTPGNVAAAIAAVRPYCVDVASGVERAPGDKDLLMVRDFIAAARGA